MWPKQVVAMDDTLAVTGSRSRPGTATARPRVYCVPHAGGSAAAFADLRRALRPELEVVFLEPSGHGRRLFEPLAESVHESADDLYRTLRDALRPADVLLGHSLGSWIAYELVLRCQQYGPATPRLLVCSASAPPPPAPADNPLYSLPDAEFLAKVAVFGRLPSRMFDDPDLRQIYLPILRRDYQLVEEYHRTARPVDCDVLVLRGNTDELTAPGTGDWSPFTRRACRVQDFDGGHFFLYEQAQAAARSIKHHYGHSPASGLA
jgi:surfactin synthase thioesterase subunit